MWNTATREASAADLHQLKKKKKEKKNSASLGGEVLCSR